MCMGAIHVRLRVRRGVRHKPNKKPTQWRAGSDWKERGLKRKPGAMAGLLMA